MAFSMKQNNLFIMTDSAEYWFYSKIRKPYMGEIFYHIGDICEHYKPETGNTLTSKYINDINCHSCKKIIEVTGNIYDLKEGISPKQQKVIDKEKAKYKHGKCIKCGQPMSLRKNKIQNKEFLGCSNFPKCKHTENIKQAD